MTRFVLVTRERETEREIERDRERVGRQRDDEGRR
jgi:hypothetical protein